MNFSQRRGYKPVPQQLQRENMSRELRNQLWNVLQLYVWSNESYQYRTGTAVGPVFGPVAQGFWYNLWDNYFRLALDRLPVYSEGAVELVRNYFFGNYVVNPAILLKDPRV